MGTSKNSRTFVSAIIESIASWAGFPGLTNTELRAAPVEIAVAAAMAFQDIAADATVGNAAAEILALNASRKAAGIQNTHASVDIRIGPTNTITASRGILLKPGDIFWLLPDAQGKCDTGNWYAIRVGGSDGTGTAFEAT